MQPKSSCKKQISACPSLAVYTPKISSHFSQWTSRLCLSWLPRPLLQLPLNSPSTPFSGFRWHWPFLQALRVSGALHLHTPHGCLSIPSPAPTYTSILKSFLTPQPRSALYTCFQNLPGFSFRTSDHLQLNVCNSLLVCDPCYIL